MQSQPVGHPGDLSEPKKTSCWLWHAWYAMGQKISRPFLTTKSWKISDVLVQHEVPIISKGSCGSKNAIFFRPKLVGP